MNINNSERLQIMAMAMNFSHFNVLEYVRKLRSVNFTQEQAEVQALEMEQVISKIYVSIKDEVKQEIHMDELVTKKDLNITQLELQKEMEVIRKEIIQSNNNLELKLKNLEIKLMTMYGGGFLILLGVIAKGFHWW